MPDGSNLIIGRVNTGTSTTSLQRSGGATRTAFNVDNADGIALSAGSEYSVPRVSRDYCVESPESWFEDFGRAKLVRGRARVKLDRNFAAVVRTNNYHVFLSPENETKGLYVSTRNRAGFEVREQGAGTGSARFSYRIVARRRDINPPRFAKVALPRLIGKELRNTPKAIDVAKLAKRGSAARTLPRVKS